MHRKYIAGTRRRGVFDGVDAAIHPELTGAPAKCYSVQAHKRSITLRRDPNAVSGIDGRAANESMNATSNRSGLRHRI